MNRYNSTFKQKGFTRRKLNDTSDRRVGPKTFAEALEKAIAKRKASEANGRTERPKTAKKATLRPKADPKMVAWSKKVRERDGHQCQWPGIADYITNAPADFKISIKLAMSPCATGDTRIEAHHIAERSLRPDLKYSTANGIALCRTHHDWLPLNREAAIALGLLSAETYEAARKKAA